MPDSTPTTQLLRQQLRRKRRQLSSNQQRIASRTVCHSIIKLKEFRRAQSIGLYLANDGEIDPWPLCQAALSAGKKVYLPIVGDNYTLSFHRYQRHQRLRRNRYNIQEPLRRTRRITSLKTLDLLIMPLVGFDRYRNRIGMGGGFYDRALSFKQRHKHKKPSLFAIAHQFQQCQPLSPQSWDVRVDKVISDKAMY
ncbi:5-formyltetrahydrofolate cyclo-ligase [Sinobacterium norvegicum]|uniref:5-formyltetrahydrofolate cyclo-ligase n=1 Tax=Sinobacterium norvegicum TaxID=1641715 RepID=A0ABN8EPH4_9GAMM|nr:5-formyltetrahydrofolate cyclo-ligase [Sinobacterium norvegicum]CAH0992873.1 5-formyltetrahydrofolate cyclo-ligase [Sinobacterium norvegicum]